MATPLWKNQQAFVDRADVEPHVAAFMEPGTGKTRAAIEALRRDYNRHKRIRRTLIVCPLSTCKQWKRAFATYADKIPQSEVVALTGAGPSRVKGLRNNPRVVVTNFEGVRIKAFYEAILAFSPEIVIIDESHRIKNPGAVTAKALYPLCHAADRRFILTGTPVLNSLLDIFGQYKALDPNIFGPSFWEFRTRYFRDLNSGMPAHVHFPNWQPIPGADKMIAAAINKTAVHAKKSECLDLPPLLPVMVPIELSPQQREIYIQMRDEYVAELNGVESVAEFAMTKSIRLQQIIAGFVAEDSAKPVAWIDDNPRLKALSDILESLAGKQVIIWTNFIPTYKAIASVCEKLKLSFTFLTGQESTSQKEDSIAAFRAGQAQILISNPAAGGTGVDGLQVAPYSIYYLRSFNAEHFWQSRDRNHRGGSEIHSSVTHYHLMAEDTIDEVIYHALTLKQKVGEALVAWARRPTGSSPAGTAKELVAFANG